MLPALDAIERVQRPLHGLPVYIAGSSVAAALYSNISDQSYDDVDVFSSTPNALVSAVNQLRFHGWEFDPRFERVWVRWMKYGFKGWHTNSIKLEHPKTGIDVNVIYKMVDGHATTSLSQVIESFDFGLLSIGGWDMERGTYHDMRSYLFPPEEVDEFLTDGAGRPLAQALPMLPNRRNDWRNGFISQYQGLREIGRYVKYVDYGYDMSLIKDDLLTGYWAVADYLSDRDKPEKIQLGKIYEAIALHLSADNLDQLREVGKEVLFMDSLDAIMESLE